MATTPSHNHNIDTPHAPGRRNLKRQMGEEVEGVPKAKGPRTPDSPKQRFERSYYKQNKVSKVLFEENSENVPLDSDATVADVLTDQVQDAEVHGSSCSTIGEEVFERFTPEHAEQHSDSRQFQKASRDLFGVKAANAFVESESIEREVEVCKKPDDAFDYDSFVENFRKTGDLLWDSNIDKVFSMCVNKQETSRNPLSEVLPPNAQSDQNSNTMATINNVEEVLYDLQSEDKENVHNPTVSVVLPLFNCFTVFATYCKGIVITRLVANEILMNMDQVRQSGKVEVLMKADRLDKHILQLLEIMMKHTDMPEQVVYFHQVNFLDYAVNRLSKSEKLVNLFANKVGLSELIETITSMSPEVKEEAMARVPMIPVELDSIVAELDTEVTV